MPPREPLKLPEPVEANIQPDPIRQFDEEGMSLLVGTYFDQLRHAEDPTHRHHERGIGCVEVDELVLGILGLGKIIETGEYTPHMVPTDISTDQVRGLIMLWRETWALHRANPADERLSRRSSELHLVLSELGQYSHDDT